MTKLERAKKVINDMYSDTSVSQEETAADLQELVELIEVLMDALSA